MGLRVPNEPTAFQTRVDGAFLVHTFFFATSPNTSLARQATQRCRHTLSRVTKHQFGQRLTNPDALLTPHNYWFSAYPEATPTPRLISQFSSAELSAIVFGEISGPDHANPAQLVASSWQRGGAEAVRRLPGCFGAIVIDLSQHIIAIMNDISAQRRLFYHHTESILLVSPHDALLVASGICPPQIDSSTAACAITADWSLGGKSFLQSVHNTCARSYVVVSGNKTRTIVDPFIQDADRVERGDDRARHDVIDEMIDAAQHALAHKLESHETFGIEMSAGADSRAVFALTRQTIRDAPRRMQPFCIGGTNSLDVKVAQEICEKYNVPFKRTTMFGAQPDEFIGVCTAVALANNGDENAKNYALKSDEGTDGYTVRLHGNGAGIFRGAWYPSGPHRSRDLLSVDYARQILMKRFKGAGEDLNLHGAESETTLGRFEDMVETYVADCVNGYDLLDLVYACERNGFWGQGRSRNTWWGFWGPFNDATLIRAAFRMPSPIGFPPFLHHEIMRRYGREMYWWPVNRKWLLPLEETQWHKGAVSTIYKTIPTRAKIRNKINRAAINCGIRQVHKRNNLEHQDIEEMRANAFAFALHSLIFETATSRGAVLPTLLEKRCIETMFEKKHVLTSKPTMRHIGKIMMIETWKKTIDEMAGVARAEM